MSKEVKAKLCYLMKTEDEWNNITETSLKGELYIYDYGVDSPAKIKVGDGSSLIKDLSFVALGDTDKLEPIKLPTQLSTLKYNGDIQAPVWTNFDPTKLIISGTTSATDAGTYSAYFIPRKGYCWEDTQTGESREVEWSIAPANVSIFLTAGEATLSLLNQTVNITVTSNIDISNIYIKNAGNTKICTASLNYNTLTISASNSYTSGETWITLASKDIPNYTAVETTIKVIGTYPSDNLEEASWQEISAVSKLGIGPLFWEIGDTKSIVLNGKVGEVAFTDKTVYTYIIGFDHNKDIEGSGISFGCFKQLVDDEFVDVCLTGSSYAINSGQLPSIGGWPGCDLRYSVLGSTDVGPTINLGFLAAPSRTGHDPSETCLTSPVENTLLAALPGDLRSNLTSITKYSSTIKQTSISGATPVSYSFVEESSKDYLPLLSVYEVKGTNTIGSSSSHEVKTKETKSEQYEYFKNNSSSKYSLTDLTTKTSWWTRSQSLLKTNTSGIINYKLYWTYMNNDDSYADTGSTTSRGIAPIFKV